MNSLVKLASALAVLVYLQPTLARADAPQFHRFKSEIKVETKKGVVLTLPPGYYLNDPAYNKLDIEIKRLQDSETRLKAENVVLKRSTIGLPSMWWVIGSAALGAVGGFYIAKKL